MEHKTTSSDITEISRLIRNLLGHYWTGNEPVQISQSLIHDWLDDLREFHPRIVRGACERWRRQPGGKRPTPGDIRFMCTLEQRDYPGFYGIEETAPEAGAGSTRLDEMEIYARSVGFSSAAERRDAIAASNAKRGSTGDAMAQEGRGLINDWARRKGYADIDAYAAARGVHWSTAYMEGTKEIVAETSAKREQRFGSAPRGFRVAGALGVTVREYTAEELSAGRIELGLEADDAANERR